MKLSLVVNPGKPEMREIPVRMSQFLIGRDPECQLRPASPMVSKRHCAILVRDGRVLVRDFDSTNGTFLNGEALKGEQDLKDGDELKIGPLTFKVKLSVTAVDTPTPIPPTVSQKKTASGAVKKPVATPSPGGAAPDSTKVGSDSEEDIFADLLLNLEGGAAAPSPDGGDPIPAGSTVMDIASGMAGTAPPEGGTPDGDKKEDDAKKGKKISDPGATSDAARAILDKYMRRPRG